MSRQRRPDIPYESASIPSTLDSICSWCEQAEASTSSKSSAQAIGAIRELCDSFDMRADSATSPTTIDAIREVCERPCRDGPKHTIGLIRRICRDDSTRSPQRCDDDDSRCDDRRSRCNDRSSRSNCYDPGVAYFNTVITPVTGLTPQYSGITGSVQFRMRRKNKTVTLQWEPFSGSMSSSGVAFLTVAQSIWNTPPYSISIPIYLRYKDVNRITHITIDPSSTTGNIKFYLNTDGSATGINANDAFFVYAGAISWIVD